MMSQIVNDDPRDALSQLVALLAKLPADKILQLTGPEPAPEPSPAPRPYAPLPRAVRRLPVTVKHV